jgi:hypothetical protein
MVRSRSGLLRPARRLRLSESGMRWYTALNLWARMETRSSPSRTARHGSGAPRRGRRSRRRRKRPQGRRSRAEPCDPELCPFGPGSRTGLQPLIRSTFLDGRGIFLSQLAAGCSLMAWSQAEGSSLAALRQIGGIWDARATELGIFLSLGVQLLGFNQGRIHMSRSHIPTNRKP